MNVFQRAVKAFVWVAIRFLYRLRIIGAHYIPESGPVVLVPNHVTYLDAVIIAAHVNRPVRYAMYYRLYERLKWVVGPLGAFPIAGRGEDKAIYERAFEIMAETLDAGGVVCIFPEGMLTETGKMNEFRPGINKVIARNPEAVVLPVGLRNLWGSYFSKKKKGFFKFPSHFMAKITMKIGCPIHKGATLEEMRERVGMQALL